MNLPKNQKLFWISLFGLSSILYMVVSINKFRPSVVPIYPPPQSEMMEICDVNNVSMTSSSSASTIYFITPTYTRREQVAELTRLGQTLQLAVNIHWIIAEDSPSCSPLVSSILQRLDLPYTHLVSPQPSMYKQSKHRDNPRGVSSRRAGLHWVLNNVSDGVIYFGDDDNTYDIRLFQQISKTKTVSMFPVGFIGRQGVSSPIVKDGKVVGFSDSWFAQRKFPVDMAGFALNVKFLKKRNPAADSAMPYKAGYEEDLFLQSLNLSLSEIEPLAKNCSEILVWHTKTVKDKVSKIKLDNEDHLLSSNMGMLVKYLFATGIGQENQQDGHRMRECLDLKKCKTDKS